MHKDPSYNSIFKIVTMEDALERHSLQLLNSQGMSPSFHGRAAPAFALAESWVPSTALDSLILGSSVCPEPGLPELKSGVHSPDHKGH